MSPALLKTLAAFLAALAVVLNGAAAGHVDPLQLGNGAIAFVAVVALVEGSLKAHSSKSVDETHPSDDVAQ